MPLTEEVPVDKDTECSVVKIDAGCTPKLSHRKSVANDCGKSVVQIPRSCYMSSTRSSSWLCALKKSTKHAVENRKKDCRSPLHLPVNEMVEKVRRPFAENSPLVTRNNNNEATSLYDENVRTSSPWHLKVCYIAQYMVRHKKVIPR